MNRLEGGVALVTADNSDIGLATVQRFAAVDARRGDQPPAHARGGARAH
jgi:NAD(P)-dependent dehydrogenase (short-subunit alcohol dehydrogenase family)